MKINSLTPVSNNSQKPENKPQTKDSPVNSEQNSVEKMPVPSDTLMAYNNVKQLSEAQKAVIRLSKCADEYNIPHSAFDSIVDDINNTGDDVVKKETERLFKIINSELQKNEPFADVTVFDILIEINALTDSVNSAKGNYSPLESSDFDSEKKSDTKIFIDALKSAKGADYESILEDLKGENSRYVTKDFIQQQKLEKLKEYLYEPSMGTKEIKDYLYEKYYLSKAEIPECIKDLSRKTNEEFGVKMFYSSQTDFDNEPQIIYDELVNWKKVGKDDFMSPTIIDMNLAEEIFLGDSKAYMFYPKIVMKPATGNTRLNLRHELAHLNDRYQFALPPGERKLAKEILAKQLFKNELANAGVSKKHQDYAYTNENEFIAVAATGNAECYSKEFKKTLVKLGLPAYVLDLPALI